MDKLGCIYTCDGTSIEKYDENGNFLFSYAALSGGRISFVDASNPLKLLLFSKEFMHILFLDNKLAPQKDPYRLSELNLYLPTCVCISYDNGFWVYDESSKELFRYDARQNQSNKSQRLSSFTEKELNPLFIKESEAGFLLLNDTMNGILIFDHFGAYLKTIPVYTDYFYMMHRQILYVRDNLLYLMDIDTVRQMSVPLPEEGIKQVCIENKKMIVLTKDNTVKIYSIGLQ
jgi:hypothetical protein